MCRRLQRYTRPNAPEARRSRRPSRSSRLRKLRSFNPRLSSLLGPADGPHEEIVGMSVRDRYLIGKLAPMDTALDAAETDTFGESGRPDPEERDEEVGTSTNQSLVPSSMGFTFCVDGGLENVQLFANWGRYERTQSERENEDTGKSPRCWKRIPSGGSAVVSLKKCGDNNTRFGHFFFACQMVSAVFIPKFFAGWFLANTMP